MLQLMGPALAIRPLERRDLSTVVGWARQEGFAPGLGDVAIYRNTDRQGLWVGWLGHQPIGCIAAVRYNAAYGFLGLFLVIPEQRGRGYGVQLWRHALAHLEDLPCIGLEAAPDRVADYLGWGFQPASPTTRWQCISPGGLNPPPRNPIADTELRLVGRDAIPEQVIQAFDAQREPSPRPHFLRQWLQHPAGDVLALLDRQGQCHGFGRIRPCLLTSGEGWRIGPLLADSKAGAALLLQALLQRHGGLVLIDAPGANPHAGLLLAELGFAPATQTLRVYRGVAPCVPMDEIYGLACLELG